MRKHSQGTAIWRDAWTYKVHSTGDVRNVKKMKAAAFFFKHKACGAEYSDHRLSRTISVESYPAVLVVPPATETAGSVSMSCVTLQARNFIHEEALSIPSAASASTGSKRKDRYPVYGLTPSQLFAAKTALAHSFFQCSNGVPLAFVDSEGFQEFLHVNMALLMDLLWLMQQVMFCCGLTAPCLCKKLGSLA